MKRKEILDAAIVAVTKNRADTHGPAEDSFAEIAQMMSIWKGVSFSASDVAVFEIILKIVRIKYTPGHVDNWIDVAGCASCGGEIATKEKDNAEPERNGTNLFGGSGTDAKGSNRRDEGFENPFRRLIDQSGTGIGSEGSNGVGESHVAESRRETDLQETGASGPSASVLLPSAEERPAISIREDPVVHSANGDSLHRIVSGESRANKSFE